MKNPHLSNKDRNLIKGAIRRVFSRSELRRSILNSVKVPNHFDPTRPRVKTWYKCSSCQSLHPQHSMQIDHVVPVVGINENASDMNLDTLVDRLWCDPSNLAALCVFCHRIKSAAENKLRKRPSRKKKCTA